MPVLEVVGGVEGDDVVPGMLRHAGATGRIVLAVWAEREPGVLLGRFHVSPADVSARRRHTGGRVVPAGPEHVRLALALPHRSAIESEDDPNALRPEQAMNRCVRGLLDACRALGVDPSYPGRDVVTVGGVPVAWLSLAEEEGGVAIFEAGLELGDRPRAPSAAAAEAVVEAYRRRPWDGIRDLGRPQLPRGGAPDLEWTVPAAADRVGEVPGMLGALRAHVGVDDGRRLAALRIAGDVIAPVETIRAIEAALLGVPALRGEIERVVEAVLADGRRWLLGIEGPRDVAAAVMEALA